MPPRMSALDVYKRQLVYYPAFKKILEECGEDAELLKEKLKENHNILIPKHIIVEDMFATMSYLLGLRYGIGHTDDIDHLGNRRLRSVGELLQNQLRVGLSRLERVVRERMSIQDMDVATPSALINIRPVTAAIKEFFGSSQLSQFMDCLLYTSKRIKRGGSAAICDEKRGPTLFFCGLFRMRIVCYIEMCIRDRSETVRKEQAESMYEVIQ